MFTYDQCIEVIIPTDAHTYTPKLCHKFDEPHSSSSIAAAQATCASEGFKKDGSHTGSAIST